MKRILTYIFGLIIMAAPFAPSTAATSTPTVVHTPAASDAPITTKTIQVIDKSTRNPIQNATVEITSPESQQQTKQTGTDGKCILERKTDRGTPGIIIQGSHNDYKTHKLQTSWDNTIAVLELSPKPQTITLSGTVSGADLSTGEESVPIVGVTIRWGITTDQSSLTDAEGKFNITVPRNSTLTVEWPGYQTYTTRPYSESTTGIDIKLSYDGEQATRIDEVVVETSAKCTTEQLTEGIASGIYRNNKCWPTACDANYLLVNNSTQAPINSSEIENASNKGEFLITNNATCIKKTNCHSNNSIGVTASEWRLNNRQTKYECIITECNENAGYTLNTSRNKCESVNECTPSEYEGAANGKYVGEGNNRKCVPSSCKCGFDLTAPDTEDANCVEWDSNTCSNRTKIRGATSMKRFCHNDTEICHAMSCDSGYELAIVTNHEYYSNMPAGISELKTCKSHERKCTDEERNRYTTENQITWDSNIIKKETAIAYNPDGARICIPTECKCGYDLENEGERNAQCVKWSHDNMPCDPAPNNAISSYRACRNNGNGREYCHVVECAVGYTPNNQHDACVNQRGDCEPKGAQNADKIQNSRYKNVNGERTCVITKCVTGYEPNEDGSDCIEAESQARTGDCTPTTAQNIDQIQKAKYRNINGERTCVITKCATGYEPNEDGSDCKPMMVLPEKESQDRIDELRTVYDEAHKNETSIANKTLGAASMAATGAGGMMLASGLTEQKADKEAEEKMRGYVATFKCNYGDTNVEYGVEPTELPMSTELYNLYAEYVTLANDLKLRKEMLGLRAGIESEKILDSATTGLYDDVSSGRSAGMYTSLARAILDPNGADAAAWAEQTKRSKNLIIAGATTAGVGVVGSIIGNQLINKDKINLSEVKERIKGINAKYEAFKTEYQAAARALNATEIDTDDAEEVVTEEETEEVPEEREEIVEDVVDTVIDTVEEVIEESPTNSQPLALSIPGDTLFDLNSSNVKESARNKLDQLMSSFQTLSSGIENFGTININITGYTDPVGNSTSNQRLSQNRANAVETIIKDAARQKGLTVQTTATGKGEKSCFVTTGLAPDDQTEETVMDRCADYGVTQLCTEIKNREQAGSSFFEIEIHTVNDNATFPPCRRVELEFQLPALSRDILDTYGLGDTFGSIPLDSFLEIINNINE